MIRIGRVLTVQPLADGRFTVILGPAPDLMSCTVLERPPRIGALVAVVSQHYEPPRPLDVGEGKHASLTVLHEATLLVAPVKYVRRSVPEWEPRVRGAMARPLYRYQVEGSAWMASRLARGCGVANFDDPGCGKTAQAIATLCATDSFPAIIVCPTTVKPNWAREFGYAKSPPDVEVVTGKKGAIGGAHVTVINYELLRAREEQLAAIEAKAIVFDEAHLLTQPKPGVSHRAAVATRLAQWTKHRVIAMTGTPIDKLPELWRLLHLVAPGEWPTLEEFLDRYTRSPKDDDAVQSRSPRRIVTSHGRAEHLDELQARVQTVMIRRRKQDVLSDLPPLSRRSLLVQLDTHDMQQYREAEKDVVQWLRSQGQDEKARNAARTVALAKLTELRQRAALGKLRYAVPEYLLTWFDRPAPDPIILFAHHQRVIAGLWYICQEKMRLRCAGLLERDVNKRQAAVDLFQAGKADVFIAPITAGGVGLNLQRASDIVFVERTWSPRQMEQAEGRAHRIGTVRQVTATYLDASETVDVHIAEVTEAKSKLVRKVVDDADGADTAETFSTVDAVMDRYRRSELQVAHVPWAEAHHGRAAGDPRPGRHV